jgi:hypothetical protein
MLLEALSVWDISLPKRCFEMQREEQILQREEQILESGSNFECGLIFYLRDFWRVRRRYSGTRWSWHAARSQAGCLRDDFDPSLILESQLTFDDLFSTLKHQWHSGLVLSLYGAPVKFEDGAFLRLYDAANELPSETWCDIIQLGRGSGQIGYAEQKKWEQLVLSHLIDRGPEKVIPAIYCFLNEAWKPPHQMSIEDVGLDIGERKWERNT